MINKLITILLSFMILMIMILPTFAFAIESPSAKVGTGTSTTPITKDEAVNNAINDAAPVVTIDEAEEWSERKGFEIVGLLQKIAEPFTVIIFIVGGFFFIVGTLGKSSMAAKGLITMAFAGIGYACIIYAPDLLSSFLYWVRN